MCAPLRSVLALIFLMAVCSCSSTRYERYFTKDNAPTVEAAGATWKLLYFTQSQRQISALIFVSNDGPEPLVIHRAGPTAATFTLVQEEFKLLADPPMTTIWSPWTGTVERTKEDLEHQVISPGQSQQISLRWQFPTTTKTFTYTWSLVIAGLFRGSVPLDPIELIAPARD